jgi:hypothetical protein
MTRAWTQLGGARSPLGLSLHRQIKIEGSTLDPFDHIAAFRGGVLTLSDDGRRAAATEIEEVDLSCAGVEWLGPIGGRQPLAGVVAAFGPASGSVDVSRFPAQGLLPAPGEETRLAAFDLPVVRGGRVQDYWIWVVLIGADANADADADVAAAVDSVAERLRCAIVAAAGGASGEVAEGLVQRRSFKQSVVDAVAEGAAAGQSLAAGVRVSAPVCLRVHWSTLGARTAAPRPRRESDGDSAIVGWTHRIAVPEGVSAERAAGNRGQDRNDGRKDDRSDGRNDDRCAIFFRARTRIEPCSLAVEIPGPGAFREAGRSASE